jgi:hypothetical protein
LLSSASVPWNGGSWMGRAAAEAGPVRMPMRLAAAAGMRISSPARRIFSPSSWPSSRSALGGFALCQTAVKYAAAAPVARTAAVAARTRRIRNSL